MDSIWTGTAETKSVLKGAVPAMTFIGTEESGMLYMSLKVMSAIVDVGYRSPYSIFSAYRSG